MPLAIGGNLRHQKQETLGLSLFHGCSELSLIIGSSSTLYHQRLIDNVPIEAVVKRYNAAPVFARKRFVNQRIAVIFGNAGRIHLERIIKQLRHGYAKMVETHYEWRPNIRYWNEPWRRTPNAIEHQALPHLYAHLLDRAKRRLGSQAISHSRPNRTTAIGATSSRAWSTVALSTIASWRKPTTRSPGRTTSGAHHARLDFRSDCTTPKPTSGSRTAERYRLRGDSRIHLRRISRSTRFGAQGHNRPLSAKARGRLPLERRPNPDITSTRLYHRTALRIAFVFRPKRSIPTPPESLITS